MPFFVSKHELSRLHGDIDRERLRAEAAESRLHDVSLAAMDHRAYKEGGYPISSRLPQKDEPVVPESRDVYFAQLQEIYPSEWGFFQEKALEGGRPESEALDWLDRHHRGAPMPYELEGQAM
jgi:hypothetical protein